MSFQLLHRSSASTEDAYPLTLCAHRTVLRKTHILIAHYVSVYQGVAAGLSCRPHPLRGRFTLALTSRGDLSFSGCVPYFLAFSSLQIIIHFAGRLAVVNHSNHGLTVFRRWRPSDNKKISFEYTTVYHARSLCMEDHMFGVAEYRQFSSFCVVLPILQRNAAAFK